MRNKKPAVFIFASILLVTAAAIISTRIWSRKNESLVNLNKTFSTDAVDREISLGSIALQEKAQKITKFFTENPNEKVLDISDGPLDKVIKVEYGKTHYYAIYKHRLGKGTDGTVQLAQDIDSKEPLAVKVQPYSKAEDVQDLQHEIRQLSAVNDFRGSFDDQNHKINYLFCKFAKGVSVEKLYLSNSIYKANEILEIILSSFYALKNIHDHNAIHNDVHEGNLVYDPINKKSRWVDLAFSVSLEPKVKSMKVNLPGNKKPLCCKAPESNTERGYATDIYQLGFMSLRMLLILSEQDKDLKRKYIDSREESLKAILEKYGHASIVSNSNSGFDKDSESLLVVPPKIIALLFRMMDPDKEKRPTLMNSISEFEENFKRIQRGPKT